MKGKKRERTVQARNVLFTQFIKTDNDVLQEGDALRPSVGDDEIQELPCGDWDDVKYVTYQVERCPKTGRLHYQGYIEFTGKKTWSWVHKNLKGLETAHLEQRKGSQDEAINYCQKVESRVRGPFEHGEKR